MSSDYIHLILSEREFKLIVDALKVYERVVDYGSLKSEIVKVIKTLNSFKNIPYPVTAVNPKPSLLSKIKALLFNSVYAYTDVNLYLKRPIEIHLAYCRRHRVFFYHHPIGYYRQIKCPLCLREGTQVK